jgi:hypothetical protein
MSCFNSNCYLPRPPRAWSRVQNSCSVITDTDNNGLVIDPYTRQLIPRIVLAKRIAMLNKGNVLQYKANSSNLTSSQKYSKIARGQWVNRNTTWATQSTRGYTNPNTTSLKRSGNVVNVAIDPITGAVIGPTIAPVTCLKPITTINEGLPSNGGGGSDIKEPEIPPPVEPTPSSETFPSIIPDTLVEPIVIQDEGILICSVQENVCTGETTSSISQQLCHPTSDSDVPGPIQDLCWNDGTQTWYPRQRYVMTNSTDKWPVNAVLFSSVRPSPPIITSITSNINIVTLIWTQSQDCLSVAFFNIFQNGNFVQSVPGIIFTADLIVNNCNTYNYFIIAVTNGSNVLSEPSNVVSIDISYVEPPTNLQYTTTASGTIDLTWGIPDPNCGTAVSYNIYLNTIFIDNTSNLSYTINGLNNCSSYIVSVSSLDIYNNVSTLNTINVVPIWYNPPTNLIEVSQQLTSITGLTDGLVSVEIAWTPSSNSCSTIGFNIYQNNNLIATVPSSTTSYIINNLSTNQTYNFNVTSFATGIESSFSATLIVSLPVIYTTTGSPSSLYFSGSIMLKYSFNGTFIFNYNLLMEYTLVGGGGGGGLWSLGSASGSTGGGGGHILNTDLLRLVSKDSFNLDIGTGGLGGYDYSDSLTSIGTIGTNSSIVGTFLNVSTQNSVYSGQGGRGAENFSWEGGGGPGGNSTSANGGIYNTGYKNGTGGAGGSLTLVDLNNMIISTTLGGAGYDSQISSGGNGGAGHQGIDGSYYGGGGGGGANPSVGNIKGSGGNGGGGNGAENNPITPAQNGQLPGGGGGGGTNFGLGGDPIPVPPLPGNGANGIIIIKFTNP